jgi:hypothetical protein
MIVVMVKEADLDRIGVPEDYEVMDATALGRRLGYKRDTVLAYFSQIGTLLLKGLASFAPSLGRTALRVPPESLTVIRWRYAYYPLEV